MQCWGGGGVAQVTLELSDVSPSEVFPSSITLSLPFVSSAHRTARAPIHARPTHCLRTQCVAKQMLGGLGRVRFMCVPTSHHPQPYKGGCRGLKGGHRFGDVASDALVATGTGYSLFVRSRPPNRTVLFMRSKMVIWGGPKGRFPVLAEAQALPSGPLGLQWLRKTWLEIDLLPSNGDFGRQMTIRSQWSPKPSKVVHWVPKGHPFKCHGKFWLKMVHIIRWRSFVIRTPLGP